ncbi:MAG: tetratricopeptide repeat protein [Marinobacter sp.]|uniref:tetratricopeptide repeat protein n=1 Tax=Marinobacter sp. TaxID=50741 RepID=UPI0032984F89
MSNLIRRIRVFFHHWVVVGFENHTDRIAVRHLFKLAELNDDWGLLDLGVRYEDGHGVEKDIEKAFDCYTRSAELQGGVFQYAAFNLARLYHAGLSVPACEDTARYWYLQSAQEGNKNAKEALDQLGREI